MNRPSVSAEEPVAIVGMGCRMPGGVTNHAALWQVLVDQVDGIRPVPADRWDVERYYSPTAQQPSRINAREAGIIPRVEEFDAGFFGISGRVAEQMDPQQRLLLEVCWETFEDAGVVPDHLAGSRTGVFMGACSQDYAGLTGLEDMGPHTATGTFMSIVSNRLSYTFDLQGPSMTIDTACSSSLVAVHLACQSLRRGESDLAVAGGVNVILTPDFPVALSQAAMLSPDARSKAFDASANGYVRGEGAGVVLLKPLRAAVADGDRVYAVIRGSATNQDGRTQGVTVPSEAAQAANFRAALADAGVAPADVGYVEAHGTGTAVGDPIEAGALGQVLADARNTDETVFLGSVKTNIGHLEAAAGIAGLIKAALAVHHRRIPPNLHFTTGNPDIDFARLRLSVPTEVHPWPAHHAQAIASVNSFGFGGANANVVLAQAPPAAEPPAQSTAGATPTVLTFSARSEAALKQLALAHSGELDTGGADLERLGAALALRRSHHSHRLAVIAEDPAEAAEALRSFVDEIPTPRAVAGTARRGGRKLAFLFNGQGPQWFAMGRTLLESSPVFRAKVEECDALARAHLGWSVHDALLAPDEESSHVGETHCLQPTMFTIQVALVELWRSWGVDPDGVLGHSMGEIAAAHVSGALSLDDALRVICHRARIQEKADPTGAMMFVALGRDAAQELCDARPDEVWLSAENSASASTLSGRRDTLEALAADLTERGVFARMLRVNCACHSQDMDVLRDELETTIDGVAGGATTVAMYSTVDGALVEGTDLGTGYWWRNFRQPVLFAPAVRAMLADGFDTFVELSPHPVLVNSLKEILAEEGSDALAVSTLARDKDDWERFLGAVGTLYTAGRQVSWERRYPEGAPVVDLPANPWIHESYWNETEVARRYRAGGQDHPMLKRIDGVRPTWEIRWDDHRLSWVKEHDVFDSIIVPGAASVEAALAAARELTGAPCALAFVEFERACVLGEEPQLSRIELDPDDGTFELHQRPVRGDAWTRNVRGRFTVAGTAAEQTLDLDAVRARCTTGHTAVDIYALLRRKGYAYGPAFCGIAALHVGPGEALARIKVPRVLANRLDGYLLHPAVLDACFQSAILHPAGDGELLPFSYLPTGIEDVRLHDADTRPAWCYTRLHRHAESGLSVDVRVLDEHGRVLAEYSPLHGKVLHSADPEPADRIDQHFYRLQWRPAPLDADPGAADRPEVLTRRPRDVADELEPARHALSERGRRSEYAGPYQRDLNRLCTAYVADGLRRFGRANEIGETFSLDDLTGLLPAYRRAFAGHLGFLVEDGMLSERDGRYRVQRLDSGDADQLWADALTRHPGSVWELRLLRSTGTRLHDVLVGAADPLELLFPGGSSDDAEPIYQSSPVARFHNALLARAVATLAATADRHATLRILEVGGGTGGLTSAVLPVLPADRCRYVFTDVSPAFLQSAREQFRGHDFVEYRTLDLETDLEEQGIEPGSFDLVLAADVLHATTDLGRTLLGLREALAPGGVLALIEAEPGNRMLDLTFGLTAGWWAFRDLAVRPDGPLLTPAGWEEALRRAGFDEVAALGDPQHSGAGAQTVLLAGTPATSDAVAGQPASTQAAGPEPVGDWVIVGEPDALTAGLAQRIEQRGGSAMLLRPGDRATGYDALVASDDLRGVIDLVGAGPGMADADGETLERDGRAACTGVVEILQALERRTEPGEHGSTESCEHGSTEPCEHGNTEPGEHGSTEPGPRPGLFVLTRGAHAFRNDTVRLDGAPVWGLGLVAGLEQPRTRTTLIDLAACPEPGEVDAVWAQLWATDHEREIALRGGERFTRRLTALPPDAVHVPVSARDLPEDTAFALEMRAPGSLDALHHRARPRVAPGPGQVEIEVATAGLNFHDVMLALGQVPPAAADDTADTYRFGGECAGTVTRVGAGVTRLAVGDAVVAVTSTQGFLASHVTVDAEVITGKPDALGFDEAATIPIAFLTAWITLHRLAGLRAGERVLIHSATGGTGLAAVQVARLLGAEVLATAGSPEKRELLRALGVAHVMDSRSPEFADQVHAATGGAGVDVVLNSIAGDAVSRSISCLAPYGRFVELGKRDLLGDRRIGLRPFLHNLSYFGFDLRAMIIDRPESVRAELDELMTLFARGELRPLPFRVFQPTQAESAFRRMAAARHVGKLVVAMDEHDVPVVSRPEDRQPTRQDGTWLITGGLGGLGLAMADSLVASGVEDLVLVGRSGIRDDATRARVEALRERGARVLVEAVDITCRDRMRDLFARIGADLPPLRGVLHCAMVLQDTLLSEMDDAALAAVVRPKVLGAWHLHEFTAHLPLDAFVLFSSATSMIGNLGQANYAAANAFLDHLAEARRAGGQPALAVNWGAVSDAGYLARNEGVRRVVATAGMRDLTADQAFDALRALWQGSCGQVGVLPMDWPQFFGHKGIDPATAPRYREQSAGAAEGVDVGDDATAGSLRRRLQAQNGAGRAELLTAGLRGKVATVLGIPLDELEVDMPLMDYLDSLLAVELSSWIERELGVKVTIMDLMKGPSVAELSAALLERASG